MPRLSIVCCARSVSSRTLVLLAALRPVADELVIAVDARGASSLGAAEAHANRLVSFEFADAIERQWAWIASQASGEWLLWVDDDEHPSAALLAELPGLVAADDVTHYHLRRRWVWPTPGETLAVPPWEPEFVPRLFRRDPALVTFPGTFHIPARSTGPFRWVDAPLYHLDLIVNNESARREKALAYERRRPGQRIGGRPLNEAFYVPETRHPPTVPVPAGDKELLERFVSASSVALARPAQQAVIEGTRDAIDLLYHGAPYEETDYSVALSVTPVEAMEAGVERQVEVWVTNRSKRTWHPRGSAAFEVDLSYRWCDTSGAVVGDGLRTSLPAQLHPGESALVVADVEPPARPGRYVLEIDLVQEHVRWFGSTARLEVAVRPRRRVGILVVEVEPSRRFAALVSERRPDVELVLLAAEDADLSLPYPVERLDARRHVNELDALVIVGRVRAARRRTRAAVYAARLRARLRRLPVLSAEGTGALEAALEQLSATAAD